jgi:hypothetical protein
MAALVGLLALPLLALLLLAAHFVHAGLWPVAVACAAPVALLWVRRPWAARTVQTVLVVGAIEWVLTAATLAQMRIAHHQPYVRLLAILGGVAVFTVFAALAIQLPRLAQHFGLGPRTSVDP